MSKGDWYGGIYDEIMSEWRVFVMDNANEDEGDEVDENELLEDFKNSNINVNFTLDNIDAFELLEIQKYLLDNGVNHQYLFDVNDIENYVVEKVLDDFDG